MGKQLNFYRSSDLLAELEAEALAQTRNLMKRAVGYERKPFTHQDVLRAAWLLRPNSLKLARESKKGGR